MFLFACFKKCNYVMSVQYVWLEVRFFSFQTVFSQRKEKSLPQYFVSLEGVCGVFPLQK